MGTQTFREVPTRRSRSADGERPPDARSVVEEVARQLLGALADLGRPVAALRVADADGELACLIQVWPAATAMPVAAAERRRRANGGRVQCKEDVLAVVRATGRPLTRKEVVKALRAAGTPHGAGTVNKALADLTAAGELVNPRDRRGYRLKNWPRRPSTRSLF
jgi:hypothetical protein